MYGCMTAADSLQVKNECLTLPFLQFGIAHRMLKRPFNLVVFSLQFINSLFFLFPEQLLKVCCQLQQVVTKSLWTTSRPTRTTSTHWSRMSLSWLLLILIQSQAVSSGPTYSRAKPGVPFKTERTREWYVLTVPHQEKVLPSLILSNTFYARGLHVPNFSAAGLLSRPRRHFGFSTM